MEVVILKLLYYFIFHAILAERTFINESVSFARLSSEFSV